MRKELHTLRESPSIAVERALAMLDAVAASHAGLSNSDLSRRLAIPKSSASYILRVLERRGFLLRDLESGKYRLGLKVLSLSHAVEIGADLRQAALPAMRHLVQRVGLTAHLAVLDRGEAVYIERVEPPSFIRMDTWVGKRMQVNSTSVGKALVAWLPPVEAEEILRQHGLKRRTSHTITNRAKFLLELEKTRKRGYALDDEENSLGARCVAVPVFDPLGNVRASLGVSGPIHEVKESTLPRFAGHLREAAARITHQLRAQLGAGRD
jgi:DNA-binding IclR family transcriptional regulator